MQVDSLPGVQVFNSKRFTDSRGTFVKPHQWNPSPREDFFSYSRQGVIRGMHYQSYPCEHEKMVYCISGRVLDVLLDLRPANFGRFMTTELVSRNGECLFIPRGIAHGFYAMEDSTLFYTTSHPHVPASDRGVHWDSFGFDWPIMEPILSNRDASLPPLAQLELI